MKTNKIVSALWCSSRVPGPQMDCRTCPYHIEETVDGVDYAGCDCDRIAVDAADRLEELVDCCARYAEEIAVLRQRQRWIPVTERLPENGERVLAYCKDRVVHDAKWSWPQNEWFIKGTGGRYFENFVTRWIPLPEELEVEL